MSGERQGRAQMGVEKRHQVRENNLGKGPVFFLLQEVPLVPQAYLGLPSMFP